MRVLEADGTLREGETVPDLDDDELVSIYRGMRLARRFDERAVSLQRQGRMGTFPPAAGQEAAQVGCAHALDDDDLVVYQYREHAIPLIRGVGVEALLRYWRGHEAGNAALAEAAVFPLNISIGSQIPHATGLAWAAKHRDDDQIVCCHFGEGATSEGDFHEGLNFAGVFDVPAVFFCNNNQYAISVPRDRQTAAPSIAARAAGYGFEGVRVDGMDPLAVLRVTAEAAARARGTDAPRPTLIEAIHYRFGPHTTADDPTVYRDADEVERWRERDPIPRFERFLTDRGLLDEEAVAAIEAAVDDRVADAVEAVEADPDPDPDEMFDFAYETPTERVAEQRASLRDLRERAGDDAILDGG